MSEKSTTSIGRTAATSGARPCSNAGRVARHKPMQMRLTAVRPMTNEQQRRFELLLDALLAHWLSRSHPKKGNPND